MTRAQLRAIHTDPFLYADELDHRLDAGVAHVRALLVTPQTCRCPDCATVRKDAEEWLRENDDSTKGKGG